MMGRNDLRADQRFLTPELRRKNFVDLMEEVQGWIRTFRTFEELEVQVTGGGGLAIGKIRTPTEVLDTEWAIAMKPTYEVAIGEQIIRLPKGPWRFNGRDTGALPLASTQGADNREVLREIGIDESSIDELYKLGILHELSE